MEAELAAGGTLNHAASNQYARVDIGDTVWLVSVLDGRLKLIGRIVVGQVVDQDGATEALGTSDLWRADYHILPAPGTVHEVASFDIQHLVSNLRFLSGSGKDRLAVNDDGRVNAQQLQTMRVLTSGSVALLHDVIEHPA